MPDLSRPLQAAELAASIHPLEEARTLPPRYYFDPDFYALESDLIFRRSWLPVGRVDQVSKPGDYFTLNPIDEPIVVVRDKNDELRAMSRVCRHKWMSVVEGAGNRNSFQCPYHLWTYGLDGKLMGAPEMHRARDFDQSSCQLPQLKLETWEGWIFVNFDAGAAPLGPHLETLSRKLAAYRMADFRCTEPLLFDSPWNWKVMVENFMESYHHPGVHPDTLQPIYPATTTWAEDSDGIYSILHNPARNRSAPLDAVFPPREGLSLDERTEFTVVSVFPYLLIALNPDFLVYYLLEPHSVERFDLRIYLCVPSEVIGDPAYAEPIARTRQLLDKIHRQDIFACTRVQAGLHSTMAAVGRLSHLEKAIWQFHRLVMDRVGGASAANGRE